MQVSCCSGGCVTAGCKICIRAMHSCAPCTLVCVKHHLVCCACLVFVICHLVCVGVGVCVCVCVCHLLCVTCCVSPVVSQGGACVHDWWWQLPGAGDTGSLGEQEPTTQTGAQGRTKGERARDQVADASCIALTKWCGVLRTLPLRNPAGNVGTLTHSVSSSYCW
jgi:hypothetical protein